MAGLSWLTLTSNTFISGVFICETFDMSQFYLLMYCNISFCERIVW